MVLVVGAERKSGGAELAHADLYSTFAAWVFPYSTQRVAFANKILSRVVAQDVAKMAHIILSQAFTSLQLSTYSP